MDIILWLSGDLLSVVYSTLKKKDIMNLSLVCKDLHYKTEVKRNELKQNSFYGKHWKIYPLLDVLTMLDFHNRLFDLSVDDQNVGMLFIDDDDELLRLVSTDECQFDTLEEFAKHIGQDENDYWNTICTQMGSLMQFQETIFKQKVIGELTSVPGIWCVRGGSLSLGGSEFTAYVDTTNLTELKKLYPVINDSEAVTLIPIPKTISLRE